MMKQFSLSIFLFMIALYTQAQTVKEWTAQSSTQIEYLLNQIEAQNVYLDYLKKGYDLAQKGIEEINGIKNNRLSIHQLYFNSLYQVSPNIKNTIPPGDLNTIHKTILQNLSETKRIISETNLFTSEEIKYINRLSDHVCEDASAISENMITLLSPGLLEMKDDERMKRFGVLLGQIKEVLLFSNSLKNQVLMFSQQRKHERKDIERSRQFFDIK